MFSVYSNSILLFLPFVFYVLLHTFIHCVALLLVVDFRIRAWTLFGWHTSKLPLLIVAGVSVVQGNEAVFAAANPVVDAQTTFCW